MAKSMPSVTADKSSMETFHVPGENWVHHRGRKLSICKYIYVYLYTFYVFNGLSFVFEYEFFEVFPMSSNCDFFIGIKCK